MVGQVGTIIILFFAKKWNKVKTGRNLWYTLEYKVGKALWIKGSIKQIYMF